MNQKKYSFEIVFVIVMTLLFAMFVIGFISDNTGNQANIFFHKTNNYMADYYNVAKYSSGKNVYLYGEEDPLAFEHAYLPLTYVVMHYMSKGADYINMDAFAAGMGTTMGLATSAFFMFAISAFLYVLLYDAYCGKKSYKFLVATGMMFSSIFIFSFERGNIIILTVVCLFFYILNYNNENKMIRELSFVALAIAAALKGYPALFGILLLYEKRYREAIRLVVYGIIFAFIPFLFFEGGFNNIPIWLENMTANSERYTDMIYPRFNFRYWANMITDGNVKENLYNVFPLLDYLLCGVAILTSCFQNKYYKKILQLLLCIVILPVNSAEYSGLYLFLALVLLFNEQQKTKFDWVYLILFVLILNPYQVIYKELNVTALLMNLSASIMLILLTGESVISVIENIKGVKRQQILS